MGTASSITVYRVSDTKRIRRVKENNFKPSTCPESCNRVESGEVTQGQHNGIKLNNKLSLSFK